MTNRTKFTPPAGGVVEAHRGLTGPTLRTMTAAAAHSRAVAPGGAPRIPVPHTAVPHSLVVRWVLAVVLVLGVLGMHALMGPPAAPGATSGSVVHDSMWMSLPGAQGSAGGAAHAEKPAAYGDGAAPMGGHSPAGGHSMLTMCLAVLGALATVVMLAAALTRRPGRTGRSVGARVVGALSWWGRPPPWTVPSLHQLSLLRV